MRNITFTASNEVQELIQELVQSGQYANENEAINAALKLLERQNNVKLLRLCSLIEEGLNSGPAEVVDEDKLLQELKASQ